MDEGITTVIGYNATRGKIPLSGVIMTKLSEYGVDSG